MPDLPQHRHHLTGPHTQVYPGKQRLPGKGFGRPACSIRDIPVLRKLSWQAFAAFCTLLTLALMRSRSVPAAAWASSSTTCWYC